MACGGLENTLRCESSDPLLVQGRQHALQCEIDLRTNLHSVVRWVCSNCGSFWTMFRTCVVDWAPEQYKFERTTSPRGRRRRAGKFSTSRICPWVACPFHETAQCRPTLLMRSLGTRTRTLRQDRHNDRPEGGGLLTVRAALLANWMMPALDRRERDESIMVSSPSSRANRPGE